MQALKVVKGSLAYTVLNFLEMRLPYSMSEVERVCLMVAMEVEISLSECDLLADSDYWLAGPGCIWWGSARGSPDTIDCWLPGLSIDYIPRRLLKASSTTGIRYLEHLEQCVYNRRGSALAWERDVPPVSFDGPVLVQSLRQAISLGDAERVTPLLSIICNRDDSSSLQHETAENILDLLDMQGKWAAIRKVIMAPRPLPLYVLRKAEIFDKCVRAALKRAIKDSDPEAVEWGYALHRTPWRLCARNSQEGYLPCILRNCAFGSGSKNTARSDTTGLDMEVPFWDLWLEHFPHLEHLIGDPRPSIARDD